MRSTIDASGALRKLSGLHKQAVFAAGLAANETAKVVQQKLRATMQERLDQPVGFTLNSTFIRFARRGETTATVDFRFNAGKGTPAYKYLEPLVHGGLRRLKRYERALALKGMLPAGMMTVGGAAFVNAAGNIPAPLIVRMLSGVKAFGEQGYVANRTAKSAARKREEFFVKKTKWAGKPAGVWMRPKGRKGPAKPVVIFTREAKYKPMLPWHETARMLTQGEYPRQYRLALAKALRTARL
ncbi:hypothetical protein [Niveispirillum fermenti]|uniref:hypothetical protein n=1 Tax=Niveispirillum fermenti TaxID=1233113 RepID=UPI003A8BFF23